MTKREIIYLVLEKVNVYSDDTDMSQELISTMIDTKRAMLLKQQFSKNPWHLPVEVKQELCLSLEVTDAIDGISCFGKILRTKVKLPGTIKIKGKEGPLNIRKYDRTEIGINLVPIEKLPFLGSNPSTAMLTYAALDYDGKLYLLSNRKNHLFLEAIKVTDIFEQPDLAAELECNTQSFSIEFWDQDYPVEGAMIDQIVTLIAQDLVKTLQVPKDDINDAEDTRQ